MKITFTDIDKWKIIKPNGRIDWENARTLDLETKNLIESGSYHLVFDLDDVSFICSGGIGVLAYNLAKVKRKGGAIWIISNNEYVNYIFETMKFSIIFEGYFFKTFDAFKAAVMPSVDTTTK